MTQRIAFDDFWSKDALAYKARVVEFARSELGSDLDRRDRDSEFPRDDWLACARFGLLGLCLPESYGGAGGDIARAVLAMEGLGYGCRDNGLTLALNAQMWTTQMSIFEFGTEEQKRKYLPELCAGRLIAAQSVSEPASGSDAYALRTEARSVDGGYVLNGEKVLITLGPVADVFLVFTTIDPKLGQWGVTTFLVERDTPGLHLQPSREKMGLRTVPLGGLRLEDCFVPESARLGAEGGGVPLSNTSLEWERSCMLASHIGIMEHQLEVTIEYAREREQFGRTIGSFQSVSNRIANMKIRLESARMLVYRVAWLKSQGKSATLEAAMAKYHLGESLVESSLDAVRVHGGKGYLTETGVERDLRDAVGTILYGGTSDIQRVIVARLLGLKG